jgi:large subunit ribosomal protein L17
MRHQRSGKKLGRDSAHRKALYANLTGALIEHGRIKTTVTKAKAVKPIAEQMITLGRRGDLHARRQAVAFLRSKDVVHKLFTEVGPGFAERPGGYLRIVKLGPRPGDAAEMAYLELVDTQLVFKTRLPVEDVDEAAEAEVDEVEDAEAEATVAVDDDEAEAVEAEADVAVEDDVAAEEEAEAEEPAAEAEPAVEADESAGDEPDPEK